MRGYGERDFVKALVPLLISRLPDPFSPTKGDMDRVAEAAEKWVEMVVDLRTTPYWSEFLIDWNNSVSWNEADPKLEADEDEEHD